MAISDSEKTRLRGGGGGDLDGSGHVLDTVGGRRQRSLSRSSNKTKRAGALGAGAAAGAAAAAAAAAAEGEGGAVMDGYGGWLDAPRHDPIATDTNLAEIDFEDFRNEDLAYAFSCGVSDVHSRNNFYSRLF